MELAFDGRVSSHEAIWKLFLRIIGEIIETSVELLNSIEENFQRLRSDFHIQRTVEIKSREVENVPFPSHSQFNPIQRVQQRGRNFQIDANSTTKEVLEQLLK